MTSRGARRAWARAGGGAGVVSPRRTHRLRCRQPFDWHALWNHLAARAIAGVEWAAVDVYRRTWRLDRALGIVEVRYLPARALLFVRCWGPALSRRQQGELLHAVQRVCAPRVDVGPGAAHLARDPLLAPLVAARPGLRVPGTWDGFELAVRAVLGQQVTLAAARGLAARLVELCGTRLPAAPWNAGLTHVFPTPEQVAQADLDALGMPGARRRTLRALACAVRDDPNWCRPAPGGLAEALARWRTLPGVGDWTAQYVALRGLGEQDAFPAGDVGLQRAAAAGSAARPTPAELLERAQRWSPWRAYAAQHLWTALALAEPARPARPRARRRRRRPAPKR